MTVGAGKPGRVTMRSVTCFWVTPSMSAISLVPSRLMNYSPMQRLPWLWLA